MKYITVNDYLKQRFGCKVYKISINGGFTCPNRDGTLGDRGCIFCSGLGSGDFAEDAGLSVTEQIERGKKRVSGKMGKHNYRSHETREAMHLAGNIKADAASGSGQVTDKMNRNDEGKPSGKYIAYFQAFTNTYAPVSRLRELFTEAINHPDIVLLSVATRPDCLPEDVLELLSGLNEIKPVWVELGLQTIHEESAGYIRRGYPLSVYDEAVKALNSRGIEVITHVILGLPGESREDMLETVRYVGESKAPGKPAGIKLQLLHVIEGTDLARDYAAGRFTCMSMGEYVDLVHDCIELLPEDMVIHRMTGDGDKRTLIAPLWSGDKKRVLNALNHRLLYG